MASGIRSSATRERRDCVDRDVDLFLVEAADEPHGGNLLRAACIGLGLEAGVFAVCFVLWRLLAG